MTQAAGLLLTFQVSAPHRAVIGPPDQKTDFAFFGAPYRKRVGWWLKGLPPLVESERPDVMPPSLVRDDVSLACQRNPAELSHAGLHTVSRDRARFSPQMAAAMAEQWGGL